MPLLDSGYRKWEGEDRGIWYRRGVIAQAGLKGCLSNTWMKRIIGLAWITSLIMVMLLFFIGQLIVPDSMLQDLVDNLGSSPVGQPILALQGWLADHPELAVHFTYNVLFCIYTNLIGSISIALAIAIPQLITIDLASRAMLVYSSKAINRFDYFLGKVGIAFGILFLTWLGPTLVAWFFGNLLAPNWSYFMYSFPALLNSLQFICLSMLILAILALGVSAFSSKEKSTTAAWIIIIWLVGNAFIPIGRETKGWLQHFSFSHNLDQIGLWSFQIRADLAEVYATVPFLELFFGQISSRRVPFFLQDYDINGALIGLGIMSVIAMLTVHRKVKAE